MSLTSSVPFSVPSIKPGSVLVRNSQLYVAVSPVSETPESVENSVKKNNILGLDSFHMLEIKESSRGTTSSKFVGSLMAERIEELDLLRELDDTLAIRFRGDYVTKEFPISEFQDEDNRILRGQDGTIFGIYHVKDRDFLKSPEVTKQGDWRKNILHLDESTFKTNTHSQETSLLSTIKDRFLQGLRLSPTG